MSGNGDRDVRVNGSGKRFGVRGSVAAVVMASAAALALTGCQSGDSSSASVSPGHVDPPSASAPSASAPSASAPSASGVTTSPSAEPAGSASSPAGDVGADVTEAAAATPTCKAGGLEVTAHQAAHRPSGTGTGAAVVEFTNTSAKSCRLKGHPSVAGAGNGSPGHNSPLAVTPKGSASAVTLAPKGRAWVKLTFVQVQGEGDGYCASGADPVVYPTLVVGLPGSGKHQVALDDGQFAECDNKVTATAVSAVEPS
ncbi:DUF4232 domain-containing protein [Streptomyces asoensis]|uniref:DUF4232 domain-containing protein n=1 Tax=Streptomyces asoensis TaxID=249586 RepID=UPI003D9F900C